jgi:hypothetical protein
MKNFFKIPKWLNDIVVNSQDSGVMPEQIGLGIVMMIGIVITGNILFIRTMSVLLP